MNLFKKVFGWLLALALSLWSALPKLLDWVGRSTLPDDWRQLMTEKLPFALQWLFSTPGWVPGVLAAILTGWLIWASWPRPQPKQVDTQAEGDGEPKSSAIMEIVANRRFEKAAIRLDGKRFINCDFESVFVTWDGGPYSFEGSRIEPSKVDGFQTNNPKVTEELKLFGLLGLLHPRGIKEMGIPVDPDDEFLLSTDIPLQDRASLKLHMQKNQTPQEVQKTNIWRWFVFSTIAISEEKKDEKSVLHTTIFICFDRPIDNQYYKLYCSKDGARVVAVDYTARTAILQVEGNIDDAILDLEFSSQSL